MEMGKKTAAVFMSIIENSMSPAGMVISGAMRAIRENGMALELVVCPFVYGHLKEKYERLSSKFCCGAIIFALSERDMQELEKQKLDIPIVVYNWTNGAFASVYVDDYSGGMQAAGVFAQKGFRRVGLVSSCNPNKSNALRVQGYKDGCRRYGLELRDEWQVCRSLGIDGGRAAAEIFLAENGLPESLFVTNDEMALGILQAFHRRKIWVPEKISILSYGGNEWNEMVTPSLSCIRLPIEKMSGACIELLQSMLESGELMHISRIFPLEIEYRESCTRPEE